MTDYPTQRPMQTHHFQTHDGVELFYRHWPVTQGERQGSVLMFHRGHEHSGRMAHLADELALDGFELFAWDARGHGRSPGPRGHSPSFGTSVRDIQTFMEHLSTHHEVQPQDCFVIAQSVGAVLVSAWVHDHAPPLRGMSLASPAFKVKLYVPFARSAIRAKLALTGDFFVNSYVKPKFLTHDKSRIASYQRDPLISRPISANILLGLYDTAERVVADAAAITVPTQLLISGSDWVVHAKPQHDFFERLGSSIKEKSTLPGFFHDTLGERDRAVAVDAIRGFIQRVFSTPFAQQDVRDADQRGFTHEESQRLARPLAPWSPRGAYWALTRAGLKVGEPLSDGLAIGHRTGFDSGSTLDYVYRNQPQGRTVLGRLIDKTYLSSIGWRGIRQRKVHVEELIERAMHTATSNGLPLNLLDIAAGHGRYILDAIRQSSLEANHVQLRDYSDINVRDGQALIASRGVQDRCEFVKADAFNREALAQASPTPTVAVVSGLYELFPDNTLVSNSLAGLAEAMPHGACLVYTGQPWHPQLELIARALTSHRGGQAWVMRRRTQQEMDQLVAAAGFRKLTQRTDEWGIFTVSLAVRERT